MAKKIKISDVASKIEKYISAYNLGFDISYSFSNSSDKFGNRTSLVLTELLPVVIIVSFEYYKIAPNESLSNEKKKTLSKIIDEVRMSIEKEGLSDGDIEYFDTIASEAFNLEITKAQYGSRSFIQYNSKSSEHATSFNEPTDTRSSSNIVLKINGAGSEAAHVRIGINIIDGVTKIEIVDIVDKRNGN